MADSSGDGGGAGADSGPSVAAADAPTRQSSDQPTPVIDSSDGQERGDAKPPGRPVDSDNGRKAEAREPAHPVRADLGRKSDSPPKSVTDAAAQPQDWHEGEPVELQTDQTPDVTAPPTESPVRGSPDVEAARADVKEALDRGERIQEARDEVDAAFDQATADGLAPNTKEQFEAEFQEKMDKAPTNPDAKQVEFHDPTDAPTDASQVDRSETPEALSEVHTPEERRVVDEAKADLADRVESGEVLGGDPIGRADQWHPQGQNERGFHNDCGLATVSGVARDCGVNVTESDVVDRAAATGNCDTSHKDQVLPDGTQDSIALNGGTDGERLHGLLESYGIENTIENPQDNEELAAYVEQGRGVIAEVDAQTMWDQPWTPKEQQAFAYGYSYFDADGRSDVSHAVQVTGTVRDASGALTGFVVNDTGSVNDTGRPDGAGKVIPIERWDACWNNTNNDHETIVTKNPTSAERVKQ